MTAEMSTPIQTEAVPAASLQIPNRRRKVALASLLVISAKLASSAIRLVNTIVLARLLAPEDFGLIALAYVIVQMIEMLTETGVQKTLVASKRADAGILNTAWSIQLLRGAGLLGLLCAGSYPMSYFYGEPRLTLMLVFLSLQPLLCGMRSPALYMAQRDAQLFRVVVLELAMQLVNIAVTLTIAVLTQSVFCVVFGLLAGEVLMVIGSHLWFNEYHPRPGWDPTAASEIFSQGRWVWPMAALFFTANCLDRLLGRMFLGETDFGLYALSINLIQAINSLVSNVIHRVYFPLFAKVARERPEALADELAAGRIIPQIICITSGAALFVLGPHVAGWLFDERYQSAGWMISVLAVRLIVLPIINLCCRCLFGIGEACHETFCFAIATVLFLILTPTMYYFAGNTGFVFAVGLNYVWCLPYLYYVLVRRNLFRIQAELQAVGLVILGVALGLLVAWLAGPI